MTLDSSGLIVEGRPNLPPGKQKLALSLEESLTILGVGVLLGLVGSWFAAARHMRRIEPR